MAKNITWTDRTDDSAATGETTEWSKDQANPLKSFINAPVQSLGAFDGSLLQIDGTGNYDDFTMSANLEITFAESEHEEGNAHIVEITSDGTKTLTFTKPSAFSIVNYTGLTNEATLASGTYIFSFFFIGGKIKIFKQTGSLITNSAPLLSSIAVASDNGSVVLTFNKGCYANNDGTGDLQVADFTPSLNGGTATNPVLSVPTHSAGDSTAGFTLSYTGTADGLEVLTITPADGASVFEVTGVAMDAGQTADDNLEDQTAPTLTSATIENATDDILDLVFDEAVNITITGWNIDTDGAALSISSVASGDGTSTPKFQLSRSVLDSETLNVDYDSGVGDTTDDATIPNDLASITDRAVVNNVSPGSIIVMQDDFTGVTIDTGKWTEVDPDGVISQDDELLFITSGSISNRADYIESKISSGTLAACQITTSGNSQSPALGQWLQFWDQSSDNEITIGNQATNKGLVRLLIRKAGSSVYDENVAISKNNTFKILRDGDDISFWYLSAPDTWTILNPTTNPETVTGMPSTMYAGIFASASDAGTVVNDDFFLTNADYSTSVPV